MSMQFPKFIAVTALVVPGIISTIAIPAYGAEPVSTPASRASAAAHSERAHAQRFAVPATVTPADDIHRDPFTATSQATLAARQVAARRASARHLMAGSVGGASISSLLVNPPQPHFSLSAVVAVAEKYRGVPYVYGGESPAGFDCSGFTAYVYAQFGIALPHSAAEQGAIGTKIARSAARPGDVVVMDGGAHVGIYLGGGRMIDAPEPGRVVSERAIYDNDYYIVRFGI